MATGTAYNALRFWLVRMSSSSIMLLTDYKAAGLVVQLMTRVQIPNSITRSSKQGQKWQLASRQDRLHRKLWDNKSSTLSHFSSFKILKFRRGVVHFQIWCTDFKSSKSPWIFSNFFPNFFFWCTRILWIKKDLKYPWIFWILFWVYEDLSEQPLEFCFERTFLEEFYTQPSNFPDMQMSSKTGVRVGVAGCQANLQAIKAHFSGISEFPQPVLVIWISDSPASSRCVQTRRKARCHLSVVWRTTCTDSQWIAGCNAWNSS